MASNRQLLSLLADLVLAVHCAFVLFVVGGFLLICLGGVRRWNWVRNFWFRITHVGAIGFVVVESLLGCECPLTTAENRLRALVERDAPYAESFMQHWLHRLMFFEASETVFTVAYVIFFLGVLVSHRLVPPRRPGRAESRTIPVATGGRGGEV